MTINEYNAKLKRLDFNKMMIKALKNNEKIIIDSLKEAWDKMENPSGALFRSGWHGSEVSEEYRKRWNIEDRGYLYIDIEISGDTRKNMKLSNNATIYSATNYWKKIKRNFSKFDDLTDFSQLSKRATPKEKTAMAFIILIKNSLRNGN